MLSSENSTAFLLTTMFATRTLHSRLPLQLHHGMGSTRLFSSTSNTRSALFSKLRFPSRPASGARGFMSDAAVITRPTQAQSWTRLAVAGVAIGGTMWATSAFLNRETRDALNPFEREYLHGAFKYTGAGLTITAVAARAMFKSGLAFRMMSMNPWVVLGVGLAGGIGSMMGIFYTDADQSPVLRHAFWLSFNAFQAATLSPLFFFSPALLGRAALYTAGVVGSLSYVGATARNDKFLYMGGPLLAGVTVIALSSLAPMALPLGMRGLAITEAISLYGGLAVFSGFVLYDTQKILHRARMAQAGLVPRDTMRESVSLQLDFINIFVRLVQILAMQQNRKK